MNIQQIMHKLLMLEEPPMMPAQCPPVVLQWLAACFAFNPDHRASARDLRQAFTAER